MKTKEQLAEEYRADNWDYFDSDGVDVKECFIAGFDAALSQASDSTDEEAYKEAEFKLRNPLTAAGDLKPNFSHTQYFFRTGIQHGRLSERNKHEEEIKKMFDLGIQAAKFADEKIEQERARSAKLLSALKNIKFSRGSDAGSVNSDNYALAKEVIESYEKGEK